MEEQRPWHRLFGLSWIDFFRGLPVTVEMEKDLSLKKQLLDTLLIRTEAGPLECRLPDGFEELAPYNLVSFKSHQEKLSGWTLNELVGHYVNLRKQVSPSMDEADLLPEEQFRLFAVSVRFPQQLAGSGVALELVQEGVYEVRHFTRRIRLVVINQLPLAEHNALLHLFSTKRELLAYGAQHYRIRSDETSSLLYKLFKTFQEEMHTMPDALEEFTRQTIDRILKELPVKKRLEGLSPEQRLEGLSPEDRHALLRLLQGQEASSKLA
jgi:hypothetical protein